MTPKFRKLLRDAQDSTCPYCACPLGARASIDHVVPKSAGGTDRGNLMLAHKDCNGRKGSRMPTALEMKKLARVNEKLGAAA